MNRKRLVVLGSIATMGFYATSCTLIDFEPFADADRDEYGQVRLLDTPRMWNSWAETVNRQISREASGFEPFWGKSSWDEAWLNAINHNNKFRENPTKYNTYIIEQRREAGLPPLKFEGKNPEIE